MEEKKKCIICVGPVCSGKSTWSEKQKLYVLSCDKIRASKDLFKQPYKYSSMNEELVWEKFYKTIRERNRDFIIDNTNCRELYIQKILKELPKDYEVEYKIFDVPLWKLYIRNYWRYINTGKWIPLKIVKSMHLNFNKIKHKYG